jgi:tRNA/tmRNA/rRNA uracil-C5-methylase (TrmA/RlmC/RlmD family)
VNRELSKLRAHKPVEGHYTLRAPATPRIFSQTNDAVAAALRDLVYEIVPSNQDLLIDAYCGAGFFSKALLDKFEKVIGIDWDKFAIAEAQKTATSQENYIAGDVETELEKVAAVHRTATIQKMWPLRSTAATMIVDPPATGLSPKVREAIENLAPDNFIYVSCNPATLARDLLELKNHFEIRSVTPLDMFPQTAEIEVVVSASSR